MSASRSYSPPLDPIYGGYPLGWAKISGAQNLSGFSQFLPGHWALGLQKFQVLRLYFRALVCRTNVPDVY